MNKRIYTILVIAILIILSLIYLFANQNQVAAPTRQDQISSDTKASSNSASIVSNDEAFKNALNLYITKKSEGLDMSAGPCLGRIANDWVLDIAHNPRLPIDDKEENQCEDVRQGIAKHFIELDEEGNLIRSN